MSVRDIPDLSTLCLKVISKSPKDFINEKTLQRPYQAYPTSVLSASTQMMMDYFSEAGRLNDDVFPIESFRTGRTFLSLKNSKVSVSYLLDALRQCPDLIRLDVSGCFLVDDDVIAEFFNICPRLQNLCIRNCRKLSDKALESIQGKSKHLNALHIGGNVNITDTGLLHFIKKFTRSNLLEEFHISGLTITTDVLDAIAKHCTSLRSLSLGYAILSSDIFKDFMEKIGSQLEYLCVAWVGPLNPLDTIASDYLYHVSCNCPKLTDIDITGIKNVSISSLQQLIDYKISQTEKFPTEWKKLERIKMKFITVAKQQVETLRLNYPTIEFEC